MVLPHSLNDYNMGSSRKKIRIGKMSHPNKIGRIQSIARDKDYLNAFNLPSKERILLENRFSEYPNYFADSLELITENFSGFIVNLRPIFKLVSPCYSDDFLTF